MSRFIPNEKSKILFSIAHEDKTKVTLADITSAIDLTPFVISLNASTQGNTVPTPDISTLFETSIPGTVQAAFSADMYRDDDPLKDLAWNTLPRKTKGHFLISRTGPADGEALAADDTMEVWPVWVVSRTMSNIASNTAATFTIQCAVFEEPNESVKVTSA